MATMRLVKKVLASSALLVGCAAGGGSPVQAPVTTTQSSVAIDPSAADPIDTYSGRYRITGSVESDDCGGAFALAARHVTVLPSHELRADVANRTYSATATADALLAEGDFAAAPCSGTMHERWTLERVGDGLEGRLVSEWPLPPECAKRCRLVLVIHGRRGESNERE